MKTCIITLILTFLAIHLRAKEIQVIVNKNGTFDILGTDIQLKNCYPAIDSKTLKPVKVTVSSDGNTHTIAYQLTETSYFLTLIAGENTVEIKSRFSDQPIKSSFISPIFEAQVEGSDKIYKTSSQIMGGGGIKDWPVNSWENSSCAGLSGIIAPNGGTFVISTRDFSKFQSYTNFLLTSHHGGRREIDVCISTEKFAVNEIPSIYITQDTSAFIAMQNEAKQIARAKKVKLTKPQSYHWCSWYYAYYHLTNQMLSEYLAGFNTIKPRIPLQTIQIDAGYFPHVGDWLESSHRFPTGIEKSVKEILKNNYKAGIWIGPYMVGNKSRLYKEHPDWILRKTDGTPIINMAFYGENRLWGAMDEEIYTLDTSNPEVMNYLRRVFRRFKQMGITFYKTDFMLNGAVGSDKVMRHTPGKTSIEYQHEFFDMIRQEIGQDAYWLGCIAPFYPMIGYVDGMRISADIHPSWKGGENMFDESIGCQHFNNIWWQNDPDAMILRDKFTNLSETETQSLALWMGMLGGVINTSDLFHEIPESRRNLYAFLEPSQHSIIAQMPCIDKNLEAQVLLKKLDNDTWGLLIVNRKDATVTVDLNSNELTQQNNLNIYKWSLNNLEKIGNQSVLSITLKPHESNLLYLSTKELKRVMRLDKVEYYN